MIPRGGVAVALALIAALGITSCGGGDEKFSDQKIVDKLNLTQPEGADVSGYLLHDDIFCEIDKNLLNDSGEVDSANEGRKDELVIASRQGNVGVLAMKPFAPDCFADVKKKLNKLDPRAAEG